MASSIRRMALRVALLVLLISCVAARPLCKCGIKVVHGPHGHHHRTHGHHHSTALQRDAPDCDTALDIIEEDQDLSILLKAVKATGFDDLLDDGNAVLTLFAPDDQAFEDLLKRFKMTEEELLNKPFLLSRILEYHIVGDEIISEEDMEDGRELETEARFPPIIGKRMKLTVREGADGGIVLDAIGSNARVVETVRCRAYRDSSLSDTDIPDMRVLSLGQGGLRRHHTRRGHSPLAVQGAFRRPVGSVVGEFASVNGHQQTRTCATYTDRRTRVCHETQRRIDLSPYYASVLA